jgi:hypothetical protein
MPNRANTILKGAVPALSFLAISIGLLSIAALPLGAQQAASAKASSPVTEQPKGKSFSTPDAAVAALYAAARRDDEAELLVILGPEAKEIVTWNEDPSERKAQREEFANKYDQMHRLVKEPDNTVALYVGAENWPMPIPLVQYNGAWYFDAMLGKQEILYRRIGRNEMEALETCRALVDAEKDYYASAHKYTDRFVSDGSSHDGLYWKTSDETTRSPIGMYLAHAGMGANKGEHTPYHGYYYRILLGSGQSTSFAVLAFPAEYRSSGVMTFFVDGDGSAHEKDLGESTGTQVKQLTASSPDSTWKKIE